MGQAQGMDDFIDAHRRFNAMPWINTIAVSRKDAPPTSIIPPWVRSHRRRSQIGRRVSADPRQQFLYLDQGLVILDGSRPTTIGATPHHRCHRPSLSSSVRS